MLLPIDEIIIALPSYSPEEISRLRQALSGPQQAGESLDLQAELVAQFRAAKALFERAQYDEGTPANQMAQIINASAALLKQLASVQIELHTAERFRCMEQALTETLKTLPPAAQAEFLDSYAQRLETIK